MFIVSLASRSLSNLLKNSHPMVSGLSIVEIIQFREILIVMDKLPKQQ